MMDWLDRIAWPDLELYDNNVRTWLIALGVAVATAIGVRLLKGLVARRLAHSAAARKSRALRILSRAIGHTRWFFYLMLGVFFGATVLDLPATADQWLRNVTVVAVLVQLGVWAQHAIRHSVEHVQERREAEGPAAATMTVALGFLGQLVTWTVVLLLVLSNLGIEITTLVAGLGIGGVALALAVQSLAGDLIASLSIYFDRPFDLGDFIIVGNELGNVRRVGLRSTRMASLWGQEVVFTNSDILNSRIHNYTRMKERRIHFAIGVVYETPIEQLEKIPQMIREIIEADDELRFARSHFKAYGDYALVFETAYFVLGPDYDLFMDKQHYINLEIARRFRDAGIRIAYPTTTVHLRQSMADEAPSADGTNGAQDAASSSA